MKFNPPLSMTLAALPVLVMLCSLGVWQVRRMEEAEGVRRQIAANIGREPLTPATVTSGLSRVEMEWRRVDLEGTWEWKDWRVVDRQYRLSQPGYRFLMPLRLEGMEAAVLVDRGWVPKEGFEAAREQARLKGEGGRARVVGLIRWSDSRRQGAGPQEEEGGDGISRRWHELSPPDMARSLNRPLTPWYVKAGEQHEEPPQGPATTWPEGGWSSLYESRPHRQYAITWFSLAAALLGTWVHVGLRRARQGDETLPERATNRDEAGKAL